MEKFKFFASLTAINNKNSPIAATNNIKKTLPLGISNQSNNTTINIKRIKLQRRLRSDSHRSAGSSVVHSSSSDSISTDNDDCLSHASESSRNLRNVSKHDNINRHQICIERDSSVSSPDVSAANVVINNQLNSRITNNQYYHHSLDTSLSLTADSPMKLKRTVRKIGKLKLPKLFQQQHQPLNDANNNTSDEMQKTPKSIGKIKSVFLQQQQQIQASEHESESLDSGKENYDTVNNATKRTTATATPVRIVIARQASFKSLDPARIRVTPPANRKVYTYFGVTAINISTEDQAPSNSSIASDTKLLNQDCDTSTSHQTKYLSPFDSSVSSRYLSPISSTASSLLDVSVSQYMDLQTPQRQNIHRRRSEKVTSTPIMRQVRHRVLQRYHQSRLICISSFDELKIDEADLKKADAYFEVLYLNYFPTFL